MQGGIQVSAGHPAGAAFRNFLVSEACGAIPGNPYREQMAGQRLAPSYQTLLIRTLDRTAGNALLIIHKNTLMFINARGCKASREALDHTMVLDNLAVTGAQKLLDEGIRVSYFIDLVILQRGATAAGERAARALARVQVACAAPACFSG